MSSALAIAAVTAVLKDVLNNGLINNDWAGDLGAVTVSALPPDRIEPSNGQHQNQINLFFYSATPNAGWRNAALPSRDAAGTRTALPPLALDLHYLLTAYGAEDFHAEILLGYAMQLLHEMPVLTRPAIRRSLNPAVEIAGDDLPPNSRFLATSNLADQVEQIKVMPEYLSTEDVTKLWSAFQTHYRPTVGYQVSVVLIESDRPARPALPVLERALHVVPLRHPQISAVEPAMLEWAPGATVAIRGSGLLAPDTVVQFGAAEALPDPAQSTPERLVVPVPAAARAGIVPVRVVQRLEMGAPPLKDGFESNVAAFVLRPVIQQEAPPPNPPPYRIQKAEEPNDQDPQNWSGTVTVRVSPQVSRLQSAALLLNELNPAQPPPVAYQFPAASRATAADETTDTLTFPIRRVRPGTYLLRVEVDGGQSRLELQDGEFDRPRITFP